MRVGFLFNHDQIHQVAHSLPIAMAMVEGGFEGTIVVATTSPRMAQEVRRLAGPLLSNGIEHIELNLGPLSKGLARMLGGLVPASKLLVYRDNLDFFRSLDLLVVAEKTSLLLKSRYGLSDLTIVHTRHGAGDRAIGFDKASAGFDHVLCSGAKIRQRLIAEAGLDPQRVHIVGYPKFDLLQQDRQHTLQLPVERTVLYNPHPAPHLSSWYRHGRAVLDHFSGSETHGLIFAPHVMLFERGFVVTIDKLKIDKSGRIPQDLLRGANIHVDLGSRASTDMTYTRAAEIYLGDASSQVYEFLHRPRPCIFLNSHRRDWRGDPNFNHWNAGEVIDHPDQLGPALDRAELLHASHYRDVQSAMFAASFDLTERPSSLRAAEVIADIAQAKFVPAEISKAA